MTFWWEQMLSACFCNYIPAEGLAQEQEKNLYEKYTRIVKHIS